MDSKWENNTWNTPPRGHAKWFPGYQDMNVLVGYPRLTYSSDHRSCNVTVITKTARPLQLSYSFNGVVQSSPTKIFDTSLTGLLKIVVLSQSGERLELDDVDFLWNLPPVKERPGDYRNGQKGAIVELFGWKDEDIEQECPYIAEAGYLGVKVFPHHEQIMAIHSGGNELNPWWYMYQPVSYRLQGRMGTRDQLRSLIHNCRKVGLRVYHDAVVNHMTAPGNDVQMNRNQDCAYWPPLNSSAGDNLSPFYNFHYTYEHNDWNGRPNNALEFPGVPYGPMDFHCQQYVDLGRGVSTLHEGWLIDLADLDSTKEYVRQRIADYFTDLLSIGFSGFRIDAAKHMHPNDLAMIFFMLKKNLGGRFPDDFFSYLEILAINDEWLILGDTEYSFTVGFEREMLRLGMTPQDVLKIKLWWYAYPLDYNADRGTVHPARKVIQNDDHDIQNDGASRFLGDRGCILVRGCPVELFRQHEVRLFTQPWDVVDNDNDAPIRALLSSYYFQDGMNIIPDGMSDCSLCKSACENCRTRKYVKAFNASAVAYQGNAYTYTHRDPAIIAAMRQWMKLQ